MMHDHLKVYRKVHTQQSQLNEESEPELLESHKCVPRVLFFGISSIDDFERWSFNCYKTDATRYTTDPLKLQSDTKFVVT